MAKKSCKFTFPIVKKWLVSYFIRKKAEEGIEWIELPLNSSTCAKELKTFYHEVIETEINKLYQKEYPGCEVRFSTSQLKYTLREMLEKKEIEVKLVKELSDVEYRNNRIKTSHTGKAYAYRYLAVQDQISNSVVSLEEFIALHDEFTTKLDEEVIKYFLEEKAKSDEIFLKLIKNLFEENHRLKIFQEIVESKETATNRLHKENIKLRKQLKEMDDLLKKERSNSLLKME